MIASADGSATDAGGRVGRTSAVRPDKAVFGAVRAVADVDRRRRRHGHRRGLRPQPPAGPPSATSASPRGQAPAPRIAVVTSARSAIEPTRRLFAEATPDARPIVLTVAAADPARRRALEAVADVHVVGDEQVDWRARLRAARTRRSGRVSCCAREARAPIGQLVADDLLDELCLDDRPGAGRRRRPAHRPRRGARCPTGACRSPASSRPTTSSSALRPRPLTGRLRGCADPARCLRAPAQWRLGAVRLVSRVSSRSKSARSSNPL